MVGGEEQKNQSMKNPYIHSPGGASSPIPSSRMKHTTTFLLRVIMLIASCYALFVPSDVHGQCPYGSPTVAQTLAAPTTVGTTVFSANLTDNQVVRLTGVTAGAVYLVHNCGSGVDTQITIFPQGGGTSEGFNDDNGPECSGQAASINYAPTVTGTKDIRLQRYNCQNGTNQNGSVSIRLVTAAGGCVNIATYPAPFTAPAPGSGAYQIVTDQYQLEHNQMNGVVSGNTFTSTASIAGTFITVRFGTFNGTLVASGVTPLNWTAVGGGTYWIHYNTNSACGTAQTGMTTTVTNTTSGGVVVPAVSTTAASAITSNSAQSGGNVTNAGGGTITARGVCWNTSGNPTTANPNTSNGTGTGSFTSSLTGLSLNTTYYVRAYATNSAGTAYGNEVSFTTSGGGGGTPGWICTSVGCSTVSQNAQFSSLSACQQACGGGTPGWDCTSGGCSTVSQNAQFSSLSACQQVCSSNPPPPVDNTSCKCLFRDMRFPDGVITQPGIVTRQAYAGEYAEYEVVAGSQYRWLAESEAAYLAYVKLTLYSPSGVRLACSIADSRFSGELVWTASLTGKVRVQLNDDLDGDCLVNFTQTTIRWFVNGFGGMAPQDDEFWEAPRDGYEMVIMPNPSEGELDVVTRVDEQLPYQVFNSAGLLVHEGQLMPYRSRLNLDLGSGLYTLTVPGRKAVRFIIQNSR
jgi:hypothetical protein